MTPQNIAQILSVLHSKKEVIIFRTSKEHMLMGGKVIINFTCCSAVSDVLMFCISSFFLLSCSSSCSKNFIFSSWSFSWSSATKVDSADDSLGGLKRKCLDFKFMSYTESQNIWKKQTYRNHVSFETVFSEIFNEYCIPIKSLLIFNSLFNYVYLSTLKHCFLVRYSDYTFEIFLREGLLFLLFGHKVWKVVKQETTTDRFHWDF